MYWCSRLKSTCMYMYVYTCIHIDTYTCTYRYTYIHCIDKSIYLHKATCESVISTKRANAITLPPKPRAYWMSVGASIIKQNNRWYSRILNHNKQMHIVSFVLQHYRIFGRNIKCICIFYNFMTLNTYDIDLCLPECFLSYFDYKSVSNNNFCSKTISSWLNYL